VFDTPCPGALNVFTALVKFPVTSLAAEDKAADVSVAVFARSFLHFYLL